MELVIRPDWTTFRASCETATVSEADWRAIMVNWPHRLNLVVTPEVRREEALHMVTTAWPSPAVEQAEF